MKYQAYSKISILVCFMKKRKYYKAANSEGLLYHKKQIKKNSAKNILLCIGTTNCPIQYSTAELSRSNNLLIKNRI